ncbi:mismatch repair endonuclease PMS2 [Galleria mellonella]|uniref:Mismatch repair endonuclease PMS2 n=1 Tax=Galleria mellonella TaxID=7137 RepID=A0A6J1WZI0_GALME|nr:mismatch repair endonuclease PMS2 [Galleria mellonella]
MDTERAENCIKPINVDTIHRICSGQVVLSLAVAVKELVENSLDAGATNIDVKLKNYGIDLIEVSDNGTGVTEDNFTALTLKYHTSKLSDYSDLLGVTSFGFRGEALSSLCALANLTITTRHKSCDYAMKIEYDHKGNIIKKTPCSRQIGTTVSLSNLFISLPVRQKEFHKNAKREFNKMTHLLYAYCLISLGVKITCSNQTSANSKSLVVATQGSSSYKDNIACIFGLKQLQNILEIKPEYTTNIKDNIFKGLSGEVQSSDESVNIEDVEINLSEDSNDADNSQQNNSQESITSSQKSLGYKNIVNPVEFTGYISSCAHGSGRSSTDRQFFYVNSRPCEPIKIMKLVNEIYKQYNSNQYPFVFLNVNTERTSIDINVTPDKRKIFLIKEKIILDTLKNSLLKLFESIPRTLKVEPLNNFITAGSNDVKPDVSQPRIFNSFLQQFNNKTKNTCEIQNSNSNQELKRKSTSILEFVSSKTMKKDIEDINDNIKPDENNCEEDNSVDYAINHSDGIENNCVNDSATSVDYIAAENNKDTSQKFKMCISLKEDNTNCKNNTENIIYLESTDSLPNTQIKNLNDIIIEKEHTIKCKTPKITGKSSSIEKINKKTKIVTDKEDLGNYNRRSINMKTSLEEVKALTNIYNSFNVVKSIPEKIKFKSEINPVHNKRCEEELSREISKDSFKEMNIVGQFNLGFIITKLGDDLFIIDQHATDEIYNFETLQKNTELTNQKLVIPQQLELTGVNEQILMDNLAVFKKNGYTFEINENALPTKRVKLLTIPMFKNWIFGKEDIEELLFMLRESPSEYCRPSRVRAMFASRACRKSVMIGTALSKSDMKKLVDHMAEIEKPWNCPHGRPTIRHLVNLAMIHMDSGTNFNE